MIKTYEGFFSKISDNYPQNKLAKAFVDFFNKINPNVVSSYEHSKNNNNRIVVHIDNMKVLHIDCDIRFFNESFFDIELFFDNVNVISRLFKVEIPTDIEKFIRSIFHKDAKYKRWNGTVFKIKEKQIPEFISKLTIENYELFNNINKYNL